MQGLGYRLGHLQPKQLAALVGLEAYKEGLRSGIQHHTAQAMLGHCSVDAALEAIKEHCARVRDWHCLWSVSIHYSCSLNSIV